MQVIRGDVLQCVRPILLVDLGREEAPLRALSAGEEGVDCGGACAAFERGRGERSVERKKAGADEWNFENRKTKQLTGGVAVRMYLHI